MIRYLTELSLEAFTEAARNVPYQQVESELFPGIDLWIRRDDLIDPIISGNKAYKLIFNLLEARAQGKDTIVTCGGAWSNHIHAAAAAGQRFGFKTIGIIRGERPPVLSAMLQDAERFGMELRFVSRAVYRKRAEQGFWAQLGLSGERYWCVPEGGANEQGGRGVEIWGQVIRETCPVPMDECWLACGT
ncbi:1-aminocyclopropane-1-carboxylate deaminase/D-cysteine desulfhydrase, partial [Microbulbifer elongatus]|nr:1-aminocyclopropane-1-carboxylate deaminase/D-cysteine desulfhydrase [Microbulbifer elongatus]